MPVIASDQLADDGYIMVANVLPEVILNRLRRRYDPASLVNQEDKFSQAGGFVALDYSEPLVVELLTWPKSLAILKALGFENPKLHSCYVTTKRPGDMALSWHTDLYYPWSEATPPEVFLIYYLSDTTPASGCLRVVPGSHRWSDTADWAMKTVDQPQRSGRADERALPVRAGDVFVGDRRLLHSTYANTSNQWRTAITVSYATKFDQLPESIQARIVRNPCLPPRDWPNWELQKRRQLDPGLRAILPIYQGDAVPVQP